MGCTYLPTYLGTEVRTEISSLLFVARKRFIVQSIYDYVIASSLLNPFLMTITMSFDIEPVTPDDAPDVSPVMMKAFYNIPHWKLLWSTMPLEEIIAANTQRLPRNLITGGDKKRHQKAVDPITREVVGYARWIVPKDGVTGPNSSIFWPEAQVSEPNCEDRKRFEDSYNAATTVDGKIKGLNHEILNSVNPDLEAVDEQIQKEYGPYLGK